MCKKQHRNALLAAVVKELSREETLQPILLLEMLEITAFQLFTSVNKTSRVSDLCGPASVYNIGHNCMTSTLRRIDFL